MIIATLILSIVSCVMSLVVVLIVLSRKEVKENVLRDQLSQQRKETSEDIYRLLGMQSQGLQANLDTLARGVSDQTALADASRKETAGQLESIGLRVGESLTANRQELAANIEALRQSVTASTTQSMTELRAEVAGQLKEMREENRKQMEDIRRVVEKELQQSIDQRLMQSFGQVEAKLIEVRQGLEEMHALSNGMNDLKKVLSGVKTRGSWGEISLLSLLEEILVPEQYELNYHPTGDGNVVEFAVKMPGKGSENVFLPIDSKFPLADYERLVNAAETGDKEGVEAALKALDARIKNEAKDIFTKYIKPPATTDFAILYVPTEGLYAEVSRRVTLVEQVRRDYKVIIAGPTTLCALLNSLQVGFRTLAIEKRSIELSKLLSTFGKLFDGFRDDLTKAEKQLNTLMGTLHSTNVKTAKIGKQLQSVQSLSAPETPEPLYIEGDDNE